MSCIIPTDERPLPPFRQTHTHVRLLHTDTHLGKACLLPLQSLHNSLSKRSSEVGVLTKRLTATTPTGVLEDIYMWSPARQEPAAARVVVGSSPGHNIANVPDKKAPFGWWNRGVSNAGARQ